MSTCVCDVQQLHGVTVQFFPNAPAGPRPQHKDRGSEGKVQETPAEESAYVCRRHAESSAGLQTYSQPGPEGQPEAGQEGSERGGESLEGSSGSRSTQINC